VTARTRALPEAIVVSADPAALVAAARAAGATLQPEGAAIRATGLAALPPELAAALLAGFKSHRPCAPRAAPGPAHPAR
jgi:hypothetical protein